MKKMFLENKGVGFTLIEVLVAVGIIALLSSIVFASFSGARESSRDKRRVSDVSQLQLGLRLYAEQNGTYPTYDSGVTIGTGQSIDTDLQTLLSAVPTDPVNDTTHFYQYDSNVNCTQAGQKVVYAQTLERSGTGNYTNVCSCTTNCGFNSGTPSNGYIILVE